MPRHHSLSATLIALSLAGCGPNTGEQSVGVPAPPPQDSGADRPTVEVVDPEKRKEGNGFPDRLPAGLSRAVRGDVEVRVESVSAGERLSVTVSVRTRGEKAVAFADWTDPKSATVIYPDGRTLSLVPPTAEQAKAREVRRAGVEMGAGEVTKGHPRIAVLQFDMDAASGGHLDLDLDGAAVGFADPIRFRIPQKMLALPFRKP